MAPGQALISNFLDSAVAKGRVPINRNDFLKLLDRNGVPTRENMLDKEIMTKGRWVEGTMQNMKGTVKTAVCNPFKTPADKVLVDLLTDSGTSGLFGSQKELIFEWENTVPEIDTFAYAGSSARSALDNVVREVFGPQFAFHLTVQGRASELLLLNGLASAGALPQGSVILSNRPFDTTKGHIHESKNEVISCTPLTTPQAYAEAKDVFLGNMPLEVMAEKYAENQSSTKAILLTATDNGGGGQPISMENVQKAAQFAKEHNLLVWIDACRIFENAFLIKLYEKGYEEKTLVEIAQEMLSHADVVTLSFKKMYSHCGGAILINEKSGLLSGKIEAMRGSIMGTTTSTYGNGYDSYCGLTGRGMIEIISGIGMAIDPEEIGRRISQINNTYLALKQHGFPVVGGAHALYVAADQVLPDIKLENAPAEYLQALVLAAIGVRGCALGNRLYGHWQQENGIWTLTEASSMDSLRYAVPRNIYSDGILADTLSVVARAYEKGLFAPLTGGLEVVNYNTDGFYHFGGVYNIRNESEFSKTVANLRGLWN